MATSISLSGFSLSGATGHRPRGVVCDPPCVQRPSSSSSVIQRQLHAMENSLFPGNWSGGGSISISTSVKWFELRGHAPRGTRKQPHGFDSGYDANRVLASSHYLENSVASTEWSHTAHTTTPIVLLPSRSRDARSATRPVWTTSSWHGLPWAGHADLKDVGWSSSTLDSEYYRSSLV